MAGESRKIAYILGAGFSHGCKHCAKVGKHEIRMPLQFSLFEELCRFHYKKINRLDEIARTIRKYFNPNTYRARRSAGSSRHKDLFGLSIEEVVTFFDEIVSNKQDDYERIQQVATELQTLTVELISFISINGNPGKNKLLRMFVDRLAKTDVVITFNWDTILDRVLANRIEWHPAWGYGQTVRNEFEARVRNIPDRPNKYPRLLKLHGSVNWIAFEGEETPASIIANGWHSNNREGDVVMMPPKMIKQEVWGRPEMAKLSPTTGGNRFVSADFYPDLWGEAEEQLAHSRRIVFIGYSFPAADFAVGNLLRRAISSMKVDTNRFPEVDIVDPNAAELARRFEQSFKIRVPIENQHLSLSAYLQGDRAA